MAQQEPVISYPAAPISEDDPRGPRSSSPVSTHSGSSPGTSQGKVSMDVDRNARSLPNKFIHTTTRDFSSVPNRRVATALFTSPSQVAMANPIPSNPVNGPQSYNPLPSSLRSVLTDGLDVVHARAIAARLAVADSTFQSPADSQPVSLYPSSSSPISPTSLLGRSRANTAPQLLVSGLRDGDVGFTDVLYEIESPLPSPDRATRHPASLTPGSPACRTVTPHLTPVPLFPPRFSIEGVSARLSPAIITRQPQHPILTLPPISSTSSPANVPRRRSQSLRSMPALPMEGTEDLDPAEHDDAILDDLEEEEEGTGDEDEEAEAEAEVTEQPDTLSEDGESIPSPHSSVILETSRPGVLPTVETAITVPTRRHDGKTPVDNSRADDYFSFNIPDPGPSRTPLHNSRQFPAAWTSARTTPVLSTSTPSPNILATTWAQTPRVLPTPSTPTLNARSSVYHQGSRSMIDVSEILKKEQRSPEVAAKTPMSPVRTSAAEAEADATGAAPDDPETLLGPSLRRRLSMPTFGPSSSPPPYPQFRFGERGPAIQPRDEEGRERLPRYTNDIYLRAIMPRKMEFSAPGVQARDRKWRRTLCVLEGTSFRVYKCPPAAAGKGLIGNLWEKTVGVGDIASSPTQVGAAGAKAKKEKEREREREQSAVEAKLDRAEGLPPQSPSSPTSASAGTSSQVASGQVSQRSPSSSRSRLLPSNFRKRKRIASDAQSTSRTEGFARRSFSNLRTASSHSGFRSSPGAGSGSSLPASTSWPNPNPTTIEPASPVTGTPRTPRQPRAKRRHLWVDDPVVPQPQQQDLLHAYALHNSESGLGTDYSKRRNVIRIRMEGQQFLLQAPDVASVVDWIEGFQAAASIAQDLDVRPMPKGPLFPRRRRRRNRAQVTSTSAPS
ncbi:hypothetical protein BJY52DRAFT_1220495 [Lactarius psammicola]|nr:hypothetical protein BJY52DRAFT_1220495 [Lactarius psammicola]